MTAGLREIYIMYQTKIYFFIFFWNNLIFNYYYNDIHLYHIIKMYID